MSKLLKNLARARDGVTAIEYGLIAAFIALAMVAVLPSVSTNLKTKFQTVANSLQ